MKRTGQHLIKLISLATAASLFFSGTVHASGSEEGAVSNTETSSAAVSSESPALEENPAPECAAASLQQEDDAPSDPVSVSAEGTDADDTAPDAALLSEGDDGASPAQNGASDTPSLTVGDVTLTDSASDAGWDGSAGWRYDGSSVTLVNQTDAMDIHAENTGVDLSASGLNHIGTLYADGDVNITGTGIILIDSIDMLEGASLNLLTNTAIYQDGDGSAAVFLLNGEDNCYYLINGDVTGILDEEYTLPSGIHLVIPEDGQLEMRVVDCVKQVTTDEDGNVVSSVVLNYGITDDQQETLKQDLLDTGFVECPYTRLTLETGFPSLTISSGSTLTIKQDATLSLGTTDLADALTTYTHGFSKVIVNGLLELLGQISGTHENSLIPEVSVSGSGSITGSGVFTDIDIHYASLTETEDTVTVGDGARVIVDGAGPSVHAVDGDAQVIYSGNATLGSLVADTNASLTLNPVKWDDTLSLASAPSGNVTLFNTPVYVDGSVLGVDPVQAAADLSERDMKEPYSIHFNYYSYDIGYAT